MVEYQKDFYLQLKDNEVAGRVDVPDKGPAFNADPRTDKLPYGLPQNKHFKTKLPDSTVASCTFKGNWCSQVACLKTSTGHKLHDKPRVLLLGDEFLFPSAGSGEDCYLVMRIKGGSFDQFKALIDAHRGMSFNLKATSLVVPCLLAHLFCVGFENFWREYTEFAAWIKENMRVDTALCIPPYPEGLGTGELSAIRQLYVRLQAGHFGDSGKPRDLLFSLWRPLLDASKKLGIYQYKVAAQPIFVPEISGGVYVPCVGMFLAGFFSQQEWQHGMPPQVERAFINQLTVALSKLQRLSLVLPDECAVEGGLERDPDSRKPHKDRRIYLLGASNIEKLVDLVIERAVPMGVTVVPVCRSGDFMSYYLHHKEVQKILQSGREEDLLFINCLGNELFAKDAFYSDKAGFHHLHPNLLNDQEMYNLCWDFNNILENINSMFCGRVVVMGPMPRSLDDCCSQPTHWIRDDNNDKINMEAYVEVFTDHVFRASRMYERFSFVGYKQYIGKEFIPAMITDNVHWSETTKKELVNYFLMFLDNKSDGSPKPAEGVHLEPFSSALKAVKIFVKPVKVAKGPPSDDESSEEEGGGETGDAPGGGDGGGDENMQGGDDVFAPPAAPHADQQQPSGATGGPADNSSSSMDTSGSSVSTAT